MLLFPGLDGMPSPALGTKLATCCNDYVIENVNA